MQSLISVHDVAPETLARVEGIVDHLQSCGHREITLLVIPGRRWHTQGVDRLARWQDAGIELAAHGWRHEARAVRGPFHRLHAALLSRRAAEHLALDQEGITAVMQAAYDWFVDHGLVPPRSYVPPAWALGRIERERLQRLPYRQIEVTRGLIDSASGRLQRLPLTGFEADTALRAGFLRCWNRTQVRRAGRTGLPLRIGIHPDDPQLRLAADLKALMEEGWRSIRYDEFGIPWR